MTEHPDSLADWLEYIETVHPVGWDLGLDRVSKVATQLEIQHPAKQVVLVAGTNGKGSTCELLANLLLAQELSVGKSTSPHLFEFNERIQIDNVAVSDGAIIDAFQRIDAVRGEITLTYFEFASLASMLIFSEADVDVAILEVGLGGRLDAMNVVQPDLTIITKIAMDHESWLGNTLNKIAHEKAGIMRQGVPCLVADATSPQAIYDHAKTIGAEIHQLGNAFVVDEDLAASLPLESAAVAIYAATQLGHPCEPELVRKVVTQTSLPGRRTWLDNRLYRVLVDVAHNPNAAERLAQHLRDIECEGRIHALVGLYQDKDLTGVMSPFCGVVSHWYCIDSNEPRSLPAKELEHKLGTIVATEEARNVSSYANIASAADMICSRYEVNDFIVVFGSFPIVAGAMQYFDAH